MSNVTNRIHIVHMTIGLCLALTGRIESAERLRAFGKKIQSTGAQIFPVVSTTSQMLWTMTPETLNIARNIYNSHIPEGILPKFTELFRSLRAGVFLGTSVSIILCRNYFMSILKWLIIVRALFAAQALLAKVTGGDKDNLREQIRTLQKEKLEAEAAKTQLEQTLQNYESRGLAISEPKATMSWWSGIMSWVGG